MITGTFLDDHVITRDHGDGSVDTKEYINNR